MNFRLAVDGGRQEGTREFRTTLRYKQKIRARVCRERERKALEEAELWCESPTRPEMFQETGCIEFGQHPKRRDKWIFHHAVSSDVSSRAGRVVCSYRGCSSGAGAIAGVTPLDGGWG